MESEVAVAVEDAPYISEILEIVLHAFYANHYLPTVINGEGLVLDTLCRDIYLRQALHLCQQGVVGGD